MKRTRVLGMLVAISALVPTAAVASPRVFSVAGSGDRQESGDGGAATDAGGFFYSLAAMPDGGFLVTENSPVVRRVDAHGRITRVAGTGEYGVAGDGGLATRTPLAGILDVAALPAGGFLLSEAPPAGNSDYRVRRVDARGIITTVAHVRAEALEPLPNGGFLAATGFDGRVLRVDARGKVTTVAGTGRDPTDNGVPGKVVDGVPATTVKLDIPHALAVLPHGGFLIAEQRRVRRVDARGIITTVAGGGRWRLGDGRKATDVALSPEGIAALPDGGFLVADSFNARVRRVSARGVITTLAGGSQTVQRGRTIFSPYPSEARWAGLTYGLGGSLASARFFAGDLAVRPDGEVLVSGRVHVVALTTGRRPPLAVALRPPTLRSGVVRLHVAASRPGTLRVEVLSAPSGHRAALVSRAVSAGVSTLALPHLPHGALVVRATLRQGKSIATDRTAIFSGTRLPVSLARATVASLCCDGGPAVRIGRSARAQESPTPPRRLRSAAASAARGSTASGGSARTGVGRHRHRPARSAGSHGAVRLPLPPARPHRRPTRMTPPIVAPLL